MTTVSLPNRGVGREAGSIRLYYEERGTGDPILCVHGSLSSAMMWADAAEKLAELGRVITYDRRGCTRSQRPEPYLSTSVAEHADDAAALLQALAATPAIVIGRSYGGEVAIDLAVRYPEHVRALILLEGAPATLSPMARKWFEDLTVGVMSAAGAGPEIVSEIVLRQALGDAAWEELTDDARHMFAANGPAVLAELRGGELEVDAAALTAIAQPTLLVAATDSHEALREPTYVMAAALPTARLVLVPGGHMINPAEPVVLDFIREVLASEVAGTTTRA
jgi:pimeloyl-ACP methyl ester carboxylesterase